MITKNFIKELSKKLKSEVIYHKRFESGRANPVFLIRLKNKQEYVLKLYSKEKIYRYRNDAAVFNLFSNNKLVPNIIVTGDWKDGKYLVMTKLEGKESSRLTDKMLYDVGRLTAQLHSVQNNKFGKIHNPRFKTWKSFLSQLNKKYLKRLENTEFKHLIPKIRKYLTKNSSVIPNIKKGSFIHDDIQPQNIFFKDSKLTGIIDFDRAFWGDPMYELPYCETSFSHLYKGNAAKPFYRGYTSVRKLNQKKYDKVKEYYTLCKYLRNISGFKSLKEVAPKKTFNKIKNNILNATEEILKKL